MRTFLGIICFVMMIGVAYWAYQENYKTQASLRRVHALEQDIRAEQERMSVLKAEWAYLNRPDRLRDLVDLNFEDLGLVPLSSDRFGDSEQVAYPPREQFIIAEPVDVEAEVTN